MNDYAIKLEGLGKKYPLRHQAAGCHCVTLRNFLAEMAKALLRKQASADGGRPSLKILA